MTNCKMSTAEAIALILTIFGAHSIVSMPRNLLLTTKSATIINIIYVGFIAIVITFLIVKMMKKFPSCDLIDISEYLGGKVFKTIIGFIFIAYFIFSSSILLRNFCESLKILYYPMTSIIFILLTFIIAIAICTRLELSTTAKVNLLLLPFLLFSVLFIFFTNFNHFSMQNIFPILGDGFFNTFVTGLGNLGAFGGIVMLYFIPPFLKDPKKFKKISYISIGIAIVYVLLCVATILLLFSFLIQIDEVMPLYSAARYIEFGSFFQRLESIFLLIWIFEIVSYLCVSIGICMSIIKKIANLKNSKTLSLPFSLLIMGIALLPTNYAISRFLENTIYPYLVLGIVFVFGLSILLLANWRKHKKKEVVTNE